VFVHLVWHLDGCLMRAVEMTWAGVTYTIPADRAFKAAMMVEDIVPFAEVHGWGQKPRVYKLSAAFGALLRFAGARVSDEDIVASILNPNAQDGGQMAAVGAFNSLMEVLTSGAPDLPGDAPAPEKRKASSRRST